MVHVWKISATVGTRTIPQTVLGTIARNELNTLADTSCAGPNWALMELTGQVCDIIGFMGDDGQTKDDVPIATLLKDF